MNPSNTTQTLTEVSVPITSTRKSTKIIDAPTEAAYLFIPPDGGWGWMIVVSAFICYFIADGLQYSFGIFLNDIASTFGCPSSHVSLAGAICTCVFCVSAALVNRFGYRAISITGSLLAALSCLLTSFSHNIYFLIFYHGCIGGLGYGMIYITAVISVGYYFEKWRGLATGISVCGAGLGSIALPPLLTLMIRAIGWRQTFQCLSACALLLVTCGFMLRPLKPTRIFLSNPLLPVRSLHSSRSTKASHVSFYEKYINRNFNALMDQKSMYNESSETLFLTMYHSSESPNISGKSTRNVEIDTIDLNPPSDGGRATAKSRRFAWITCCPRHASKRPVCLSRPIYRDDIFFIGSLARVAEYQSTDYASRPNLEYQLSITRGLTTNRNADDAKAKQRRHCCPESVKHTLTTMLDFRAVKSLKFSMLILNGIFVSLGIYIPYMFIKDASLRHGLSENLSSWLISLIGISNTLGRISCGLLSTSPRINSIVMCYTLLFIGGVATALSTLSYVLWVQFAYCAVFGFTMSSISALKTLIIVQMVGLENLSNAIGIILMFQGVATLCGIALAAYLKDISSDYTYSFYFGGCTLCLAAFFLVLLQYHEKQERKQKTQQSAS